MRRRCFVASASVLSVLMLMLFVYPSAVSEAGTRGRLKRRHRNRARPSGLYDL